MLKLLFDKECNLIGWIKPDENIFNGNMVIYQEDMHDLRNRLDTSDRVVAGNIRGSARPGRPTRIARAARPVTPTGG